MFNNQKSHLGIMSYSQDLYKERIFPFEGVILTLPVLVAIILISVLSVDPVHSPDTVPELFPEVIPNDFKPELEEFTAKTGTNSMKIPRSYDLPIYTDFASFTDGFSMIVTRANGLIEGQMSDGNGGIIGFYKIPNGATLPRIINI